MRGSFTCEGMVYLRYLICCYEVEVTILLPQLTELVKIFSWPAGARRNLNCDESGLTRLSRIMVHTQMEAEMTGYFVSGL